MALTIIERIQNLEDEVRHIGTHERTIREMIESAKEMLAASRLMRARVESNDEVMRMMERSLGNMQVALEELNRRITRIENLRHQYRSIHPDA